jgi:hypothetical protein
MSLQTKCGLEILIDEEDYNYLSMYKWFRLKARNTTYARTNKNKKTKVISHIIAEVYDWDLNGKVIDHINKNGLDNRKQNLQIVSQQKNIAKDAGWKVSSSEFRGVSKNKNKWAARLYHKGKHYYLGTYNTEIEARDVVLKKRQEVGY